jgi:hypothetical protein
VIDHDLGASLSRAAARQPFEDMCQLAEPELGGSTTAARVLRESDGGLGFGGHALG